MAPTDDELTTSLLQASRSVALQGVDLHVVAGPDRGLVRRLEPGKVKVGTARTNDIVLSDSTVSRLHAEISIRSDGFRVVDLDSTNGTSINGVRVHDAELAAGGTVTVGGTVLRLELADEPVKVALSPIDRFGDVLGGSVEMRRIYAVLDRIAPTDATLLVQGETGTGKEAVALAVHESSRRAEGPFVAVDCGAIAEHLIESELFGHVRGAFSGAVDDRKGLFEEASGGTIFLDEVGELPLALQPKLLRVLETREVRPVGTNAVRRVDVRVIAATHRALGRAVNEGSFREDLYYRLAVVEVELPPLRARREDIAVLAQHFFARFTGGTDKISPDLVATLMHRAWPGNVRELRNFVERSISLGWSARGTASAVGATGTVSAPEAPVALEALAASDLPLKEARAKWTEQFERLYVGAVLRRTHGNVTRAAELAQVHRRSFQRMMAQHGIRSGEPGDVDDLGDESDDAGSGS